MTIIVTIKSLTTYNTLNIYRNENNSTTVKR